MLWTMACWALQNAYSSAVKSAALAPPSFGLCFLALFTGVPILVSKMPHASEDHRQLVLVGGGDDFFVLDRAAGLDPRGRAGLRDLVEAVPEREEGVRGGRGPRQRQPRLRHRETGRVHPAHLARAHAHGLDRAREHDRV